MKPIKNPLKGIPPVGIRLLAGFAALSASLTATKA